jgi:hypothetical protein
MASVRCGHVSAKGDEGRVIARRIEGHDASCKRARRVARAFARSAVSYGKCYHVPRDCEVKGFHCKGSSRYNSHGEFRTRCTREGAIVKFYEYDKGNG